MNDKIKLTVSTLVKNSISDSWIKWTSPEHIKIWNTASPDWHTTNAEVNLIEGGNFVSRMEAKDGSFGFDFSGVYTSITQFESLHILLDDQRTMEVYFEKSEKGTRITEIFEAEEENTLELQQFGWQAILDNFKNYVEQSKP